MRMIPGMPFTSSHSLSQLTSALDNKQTTGTVHVTATGGKDRIQLEVRMGNWLQICLDPYNGQTKMAVACTPNNKTALHYNIDPDLEDWDWDWCQQRVGGGSGGKDTKKLREALQICSNAAGVMDSACRKQMINQAVATCPKYCSMAYFMRAELLCSEERAETMRKGTRRKVEKALLEAVEAGRALVELLKANETIAKGQLYNFLQTRWYMRSLYMFGCLLLSVKKLNQADAFLKEYLANDIHDTLGARHKQLLVCLERGPTIKENEQIDYLLTARFGDDQIEDSVFCLWNYTRALYWFTTSKRGNGSKSAKRILQTAMTQNPHVPPLLLAWKTTKDNLCLMAIGEETEACDYVEACVDYWLATEGALEWLEKIYCETYEDVEPLTRNKEAMRLFIQGTRYLETRQQLEKGVQYFQRALELVAKEDGKMQRESLRRKGLCHARLGQPKVAVELFDEAISLCNDPSAEKEVVKELLYNRAGCKETLKDYRGALEDYTYVFYKIGAFSTAHEGMRRMEQQLGIQRPPPPPFLPQDMDTIRRQTKAVGNLMPNIDPKTTTAANLERCAHCKRGGIKLSSCAGCNGEYKFCSKECQTACWKVTHKYVCKTSAKCLVKGTKVVLQGLESAQQHNGKEAIIDRFLPEADRFCILLDAGGQELSIRPQNLKKVA